MPQLQMPAITRFVDGTGPVFGRHAVPVPVHHHRLRRGVRLPRADRVGHHAEDARQRDATCALIGYGGMLIEAFVAVMALIAACVLQPGVYFAMNAPAALIGTDGSRPPRRSRSWGFVVTPEMLTQTAQRHRRDHASSRAPAARRRSRSAWRRSSAGCWPGAGHDGVLVPLRDPVRGAVHPHHARRRHARRRAS